MRFSTEGRNEPAKMSSSKNKSQGDNSPLEKIVKKQQLPPNAWDWHGATQVELNQSNISELPQSPSYPRLEVLYLHGNANLMEIPTLFFQHMPLLQVLDLSYTGIQGLPSSIFKLAQLKTLYLRGCEHFKQLPPEIVQLKNLEKLDLNGTPITHLPLCLNFPMMRSLLIGGNLDLMEIPPSFFDHMPLLNILDLSHTSIQELPNSFFNLQELREFYLKDCEVFMELPPEIGRLITLKKLVLDGTQITHLPNEIRELTNLESLSLSFDGYQHNNGQDMKYIPYSKLAMIPLGIISKLTCLEDLRIIVNPDIDWWHKNVEHILGEINGLERLRTLDLYVPEVKFVKLIPSRVSYFRFIVGHHMQRIISRAPLAVEVKFKQSNRSLRFVNGLEIPNGVTNILQYAEAFFLDRHMTINHLSQFGLKNLQHLQSCILGECNEMQSIVDGGIEDSGERWFSSLEFLTIFYMKSLRSIVQGPSPPDYSFSQLKFLALHTCPELITIFTLNFLDNLLNLEELIVEDCPKVSSIINCQSSKQRTGIFLPRLRKLSLLYLPALVSISNGLHIGTSLEIIGFYDCPKVESLSSGELSSKKLKVIRGEIKWWEALKWSETEWGHKCRPGHFSCIFCPINTEKDVLTQLTSNSNEERNSGGALDDPLQHFGERNFEEQNESADKRITYSVPEKTSEGVRTSEDRYIWREYGQNDIFGAEVPSCNDDDPDKSFVSEHVPNQLLDQTSIDSFLGLEESGSDSKESSSITTDITSRHEKEVRGRVAFKTKSEVGILDDGFKWRKYGKKMVKNSPNPRNYYRCSAEGCPVKKRVERDRDDPMYLITIYEGIHTHPPKETFLDDSVLTQDTDCEDANFPSRNDESIVTEPTQASFTSLEKWTEQVRVSSDTALEGGLNDGYSWRKYGQKDILGAKYPREYYRCISRSTHSCCAKKKVQRSDEDLTIFDITYRGKHTCSQGIQELSFDNSLPKEQDRPLSLPQ